MKKTGNSLIDNQADKLLWNISFILFKIANKFQHFLSERMHKRVKVEIIQSNEQLGTH